MRAGDACELSLALFKAAGLQRALAPRLFRGLVRRLDWLDPSSAPAREHGEEHAVLPARIEAEDWLDALRREAADPDGTAAATALAPAGRTERLPASGRFDTR